MGWKQVGGGGGDFISWKSKVPGDGIEGIWRGTEPNQYEGEDGKIEMADGRTVRIGFPTALERRFAGDDKNDPIEVGTLVKIVYEGKKTSKKGNSFHAFTVYIDDSAPPAPPQEDPQGEDPALRDPNAPMPGDDDFVLPDGRKRF